MEQQLEFEIDKGMETILRKKIEIPEGTNRLYLQAVYPQAFQYNSYLLVLDTKKQIRLQKLLGYGKQHICIGEDAQHTTIGGIPGKIEEGTWEIVIGVFTEYIERYQGILPEKLIIKASTKEGDVTEPIGGHCWIRDAQTFAIDEKLYDWKKKYHYSSKWYKGDFHTHTRLSDGKETVENAMRKAEDMRLEFYLPTEHNLLHTGWCNSEVMVVPSVELTTRLGHMNLFGLTRMPDNLYRIMQHMDDDVLDALVLQQIREAKAAGWLTSINHPFLHIWKWQLMSLPLEDVDCMEIINDPTYDYARESNDKAIHFLDHLWMDGHRIIGVGGSDSHNLLEERYSGAVLPSIPGDPATYVYSKGLSPKRLLKNVKAGHVIVTRYCEVEIQITDGKKEYLPGDCLPDREVKVHLKVDGLEKKPCMEMISYCDAEKDVHREALKVSKRKDGKYEAKAVFVMPGEAWQWVRFEVRDKKGEFLAYVNPIYRNEKKSKYRTYGQVLEKMEKNAD